MAEQPPMMELGASIALVGVSVGLLSALFLAGLDLVTATRATSFAWVVALPIAGVMLGAALDRWGTPIAGGSPHVFATSARGGPTLPARWGPLVLFGTWWTHLFGGSAGREGTAVQMGAVLADQVSAARGWGDESRRLLLVAGVASGFGSVFGTPIAGAVFAMEVTKLAAARPWWALAALAASIISDQVTRATGVEHSAFPLSPAHPWSFDLAARWVLFASVVAATVVVFIELSHGIRVAARRWFPQASIRLGVGGALVVVLVVFSGQGDALGLSVPALSRAFESPPVDGVFPIWKLLLTAITLGFGFIGGEVTPLFVIGASLGSLAAPWLGVPAPLAAGVGMAAVFGAAARTPWALTCMAVELFGPSVATHVVVVVGLATWLTGGRSIYLAMPARDVNADSTNTKGPSDP